MPQLEERIDLLEKSVSELDSTLGALIQAIPSLEKAEDAPNKRSAIDKFWECAGCGARLGIYNQQTTELRVRYKDFLIYIIPGAGGSTRIPCRRCGHMNVVEDDRCS